MTEPLCTELVERVSRAIYEQYMASFVGANPLYKTWDGLSDTERRFGEGLALSAIRAVLLGIREPTAGMVEAVYGGDFDVNWGYWADGRPSGADDVWTAMIDALLAEIGYEKAPRP